MPSKVNKTHHGKRGSLFICALERITKSGAVGLFSKRLKQQALNAHNNDTGLQRASHMLQDGALVRVWPTYEQPKGKQTVSA